MKYSIIVAVYNRPDELRELLGSLAAQPFTDFEVIVVEDGSSLRSNVVCEEFAKLLTLRYFEKENTGPGLSRNYGCRRASGDYFVFLDSDCTVPVTYLSDVDAAIRQRGLQAFGGPDREDAGFTPIQKAISFAMTSLLTTGGIRGSAVRVGGTFHPRSFNMGISRDVFNATDGFSRMRFGEDVEFSIRMIEMGFTVGLIPEAFVYHKRRTDFKKFFKQVHNSGMARVNITLRHPGTLRITHLFPSAFTVYLAMCVVTVAIAPATWLATLPLLVYLALLFIGGTYRYRSLVLGAQCVAAAVVQLVGYGTGLIRGIVTRVILNKPEQAAFEKTFYS